MVETSDLSRARAYGSQASGAQSAALRQAAVQTSDRLLGELVARIDPARDAVLVVSPVSVSGPQLSVALLHSPGVDGGLLRSSTTRRDGYV